MKISLLVTLFNSLTQSVYTILKDRGYSVDITYAIDKTQMIDEITIFSPQIILCPFLKSYIPKEIYKNYPTFVFHPAPRGDRGAYSLDYAIFNRVSKWGGVWLRANELYDGGDIYASNDFNMRDSYKASIYRQEVLRVATSTLDELFINIEQNKFTPQILNPIHKPFTQEMRAINWQKDSIDEIIKKINCSDSLPGVLDNICGVECYLYGVWIEDKLRGRPKEILAKRDGAICVGTIDGAIWISHLKEVGRFKLPATYVLKDRIKGVKEDRLPLLFDKSYSTFYETSVEYRDNVAYLCFNFHNGAMSTAQSVRLKYAVEYLKEHCDVLVLVGGMDFFSNGIHLNILEDSKKQGEDGWANINAINDLIKSILFADEIVTIASFARNAGAGGVFLGLACDFVVAKEGVVLNPHYKTLGLSGSEYHTYTLPKRVGEKESKKLLDECLPISVEYAKKIGMVDEVFSHDSYYEDLHQFAKSSFDDDFIWDKQDYLEEHREHIESCKEREIEIMYPQFWEEDSEFHRFRKEFVYKLCPTHTPKRLKLSVINTISDS
ncbi:MAG: hydrogenase [Epsilonproteobacteria bacterium]|nr:hydrogenase [Campylobacterota bacterium]